MTRVQNPPHYDMTEILPDERENRRRKPSSSYNEETIQIQRVMYGCPHAFFHGIPNEMGRSITRMKERYRRRNQDEEISYCVFCDSGGCSSRKADFNLELSDEYKKK